MTVVLGISEASYWARADSLLILAGAVSGCIVAAPSRPASIPLGRAVLLGLMAGAASAMKLHGAAYVAPACLMVVAETAQGVPPGWPRAFEAALVIGVAALMGFALPFLPAGVSVAGFTFYLGLAAHHGFSGLLLLGNLTLLTGIFLPILHFGLIPTEPFPGRRRDRRNVERPFGACSLAQHLAAVAVVASKPGAGYPHLLPFVPYAALLFCRMLTARELCYPQRRTPTLRTLALGGLFLLAFGVPVLVRAGMFGFRGAIFAQIRAGYRQVERVIAAHPGETVAVGYGSDSFLDLRLSYLRILPVLGGHPLFYDATAMDDLWQGGTSRAIALPVLDRCAIRVWLIPGNEPFTIRDFYGGYTFPEAFRQLFSARYRLQPVAAGQEGPFRVWILLASRCRRARGIDAVRRFSGLGEGPCVSMTILPGGRRPGIIASGRAYRRKFRC